MIRFSTGLLPRDFGTSWAARWLAIALVIGTWSSGARAQAPSDPSKPSPEPVTGTVVSREDGTPLPEVKVTVLELGPSGIGDEIVSAETDAEGNFEFADLKPGSYALRTDGPGRALDLRQLDVEESRDPVESERIELALEFAIRGRVLDKATGKPLTGVRVTSGNRLSQTDEEGKFDLTRLPRGEETYDVAVSLRGYIPRQRTLNATPSPSHEDVEVALDPGRSRGFTVRDFRGEEIADAEVRLHFFRADPYSPFRTFYSSRTDDRGQCAIGGLDDPAPFVAEVRAEGYPVHQSLPHWLEDGVQETDLIIAADSRCAGIVRDREGKPVAGATVSIERLVQPLLSFGGPDPNRADKGFFRTETARNGRFLLTKLPYGAQRIRIEAPGHEIYEAVVHPTPASANSDQDEGEEEEFNLIPTVACPRKHTPLAEGIGWEGSVSVAFSRAERERRPVFLAMAMDDEPANDGIARLHFKNREIIELTRYTCPLLSTAFDHTPEGDPTGFDTRYGAQPSSAFQAVEVWARDLIGGGDVVNVPRHLFFDPYRRRMTDRTLWMSERDMRRMIVHSLRRVNPEDAQRLANRMYDETLARYRGGRNPRVRDEAFFDLITLTSIGDELAASAVGNLDPSMASVDAVLSGLRRLGPGVNELYEVLSPFLHHDNSLISREAGLALRRGGRDEDWERSLVLLDNQDLDRELEATLLGGYGIVAEGNRLDFSNARNHRLSHRAAIALARRNRTAAIDEVLELLSSPNLEVRVDCAFAASRIEKERCTAALIRELRKGGSQAAIMARALGEMKAEQAAPFLLLALKDESWVLREESARALGLLRLDSTPRFLVPLLDDASVPVRIASAEALWALGNSEGLPVLISALERSFYRERAEKVLERAYSESIPLTPRSWKEWLDRREEEKEGSDPSGD